jgi:hypothetical protein
VGLRALGFTRSIRAGFINKKASMVAGGAEPSSHTTKTGSARASEVVRKAHHALCMQFKIHRMVGIVDL